MENILYLIIGLSIILFFLLIILGIVIIKTSKISRDKNLRRCPTCGQILEPEWNRCPFCAEDKKENLIDKRIPDLEPIGYILVKSGNERGNIYKISKNRIKIGSGDFNDIVIKDKNVLPEHCEIELRDKKFYIKDLNSEGKTKVNGKIISESELKENDEIMISNYVFTLKVLE